MMRLDTRLKRLRSWDRCIIWRDVGCTSLLRVHNPNSVKVAAARAVDSLKQCNSSVG